MPRARPHHPKFFNLTTHRQAPVVFFFPCGNSVPEKKKRDTIFYSVLKSTAHNDSNNQRQGRYVL